MIRVMYNLNYMGNNNKLHKLHNFQRKMEIYVIITVKDHGTSAFKDGGMNL